MKILREYKDIQDFIKTSIFESYYPNQMKIRENVSLKPYNTFGIHANARYFVELENTAEVSEFFKQFRNKPYLLLGEGSNILFSKDYEGYAIRLINKGIRIKAENENTVQIEAAAGENWHKLVEWTVDRNYSGLENLSLIPGTVGASPVQNIGAYGIELQDKFLSLTALEIASGEIITFNKEQCQFSYRNSFFKEHKNQYVILNVSLQLNKEFKASLNYSGINEEIAHMGVKELTPRILSRAICAIRRKKLPLPEELGNAGSFFKNVILSKNNYLNLSKAFPEAPHYKLSEDQIKIPTAWLIQECGWKGKKLGNAGVHKNQALVLVNHGNASGQEVLNLALKIREDVNQRFQINLEFEVNII